jgi:hypothetical protein
MLNIESQKLLSSKIVYTINMEGSSGKISINMNKMLLERIKATKKIFMREKATINKIEKKMEQLGKNFQMNMFTKIIRL